MFLFVLLLCLALILGGFGFAAHVVWILAAIVLIAALVSLVAGR